MRSFVRYVLGALSCVLIFACDTDDGLTGCYSDRAAHSADIWITKSSGKYWLARKEHGVLLPDSTELRVPTSEEFSKLFGPDTAAIAEGLVTEQGAFGIFRIKSGERLKGMDGTATHFGYFLFVRGALYEVTCA